MTPEFEQKILDAIAPLEGWCWKAKALAMAELVLDLESINMPSTIVEIGVFGGKSLIPQAIASQRLTFTCTIYGIDPWKKECALEASTDAANNEWWEKVDMDAILAGCSKAIWNNGLDNQCCLIRSRSDLAACLFRTGEIDILHIDGNHSEEISTRDVNRWLPLVAPGGHIWFDDFLWPSTEKAVAILEESCTRVLELVEPEIGSCRLYRKR